MPDPSPLTENRRARWSAVAAALERLLGDYRPGGDPGQLVEPLIGLGKALYVVDAYPPDSAAGSHVERVADSLLCRATILDRQPHPDLNRNAIRQQLCLIGNREPHGIPRLLDRIEQFVRGCLARAGAEPPVDPRTATEAWPGGDSDGLEPLVRRLLAYMHGRDHAELAALCPEVWGRHYGAVSPRAVITAVSKANNALRKRRSSRLLEKPRGVPLVRWV